MGMSLLVACFMRINLSLSLSLSLIYDDFGSYQKLQCGRVCCQPLNNAF